MKTGKDALLRDRELTGELEDIQAKIIAWAKSHQLWDHAGFRPAYEHRDETPREGEVLYMWFEGDLHSVFNSTHYQYDRLEEEFRAMLEAAGFEYELEDGVTMNLAPISDERKRDFLRLQRWEWVQKLAERRLFDLHSEVFEHFAGNPEAMQNLHWRQFEEFLDSVFRNQGFRTELGPGSDDGGVDLRLYQSETIPEIVTLVQAKKYASPIKLEAVAALTGVAQMERAPQAMFVTASRYQPKARQFAHNTRSRLDMPTLTLVDAGGVAEWCGSISKQLSDYFATGETPQPPILRDRPTTELTGKIVVASGGYNITRNHFAVIEADYPYEVILRPIGSERVSGDSQQGTELPDLSRPAGSWERPYILASKDKTGERQYFWGDRKLFSLWDGQPQWFDYMD